MLLLLHPATLNIVAGRCEHTESGFSLKLVNWRRNQLSTDEYLL